MMAKVEVAVSLWREVVTSKIIPMPLPTPEVVDMIASIDNMTFATHPCPMQRFCTSLHQ